jgi:hypothetical protein
VNGRYGGRWVGSTRTVCHSRRLDQMQVFARLLPLPEMRVDFASDGR